MSTPHSRSTPAGRLGLAAVGILAACAAATGPSAGSADAITSLGRRRTFEIHLPKSAAPNAAAPLLLVFHGAGGTGRGMEALTGLDQWADRLGFIVVYPDAVADARHTWALGCNQCTWADVAGVDDYRFMRDLVDSLALRYPIDRQRVFATGFSLGGSFAYDLACHDPALIAGAAIVASLPSVEELALCRPPTRAVRVLTSIGGSDPNVPWNGGVGGSNATYRSADTTALDWASRNRCGPIPARRDLSDANGDGRRVRVLEFTDCPSGGLVRFFNVEGAGHEWPQSSEFDISAELVRSFFS